jgi:hypothetical protein
MVATSKNSERFDEWQLPLGILSSYLFFLLRRPISKSNSHYLSQRIKGLKSLGALLAASSSPQIKEIAAKLHSLQPENLSTVARDLQSQLILVHRPRPVPAHYVVSQGSPGPALFTNMQRILLVLCPAIGIGDEMILFPVPGWIKAACGEVHIAVMSGYHGLWDRVRGVDDRIYYSTHRELLQALQGSSESSLAPFDLIMFADFEKPGLAPIVCLEPGVRRYVEISLGAQHAVVVDNGAGCLRSTSLMPEARISYYDALDCLLKWLGIETHSLKRYKDVVLHEQLAPSDSVRLFVSPFTSKYNPSLIYWGRVLSSLWSRRPQRQVEFVLDPGTNCATERFSSALLKSAAAEAAPGINFSLAGHDGRGLPLKGVFAEMERSHVVLCADSFAAHAGPLFGCTTLVVAAPGLESWRTPSSQSFYFDIAQPVGEMVAAMREVLSYTCDKLLHHPPMELGAALAEHAFRLDRATCRILKLLRDTRAQTDPALVDAHTEFVESYNAVIGNLAEWPDQYSALFADVDYSRTWRRMDPSSVNLDERDQLDHLQAQLSRWENTNLRKLLRHICARSMAAASM